MRLKNKQKYKSQQKVSETKNQMRKSSKYLDVEVSSIVFS